MQKQSIEMVKKGGNKENIMTAKKRTHLQPLLMTRGVGRREYLFIAQGDRGMNVIPGVRVLDVPPVIIEGDEISGIDTRLLKRAPLEANAAAYDPREKLVFTSCEQEGDLAHIYRAVVYCVIPK